MVMSLEAGSGVHDLPRPIAPGMRECARIVFPAGRPRKLIPNSYPTNPKSLSPACKPVPPNIQCPVTPIVISEFPTPPRVETPIRSSSGQSPGAVFPTDVKLLKSGPNVVVWYRVCAKGSV